MCSSNCLTNNIADINFLTTLVNSNYVNNNITLSLEQADIFSCNGIVFVDTTASNSDSFILPIAGPENIP